MTARIVMPMLRAMPTPTIMLSSARQRLTALRSGYGSRRAQPFGRAPDTLGLRAGTIVAATGCLGAFGVETCCLVGEIAEGLLAGFGVVVVGVGRQAAIDEISQGNRQPFE